jgi:hypothetical protein
VTRPWFVLIDTHCGVQYSGPALSHLLAELKLSFKGRGGLGTCSYLPIWSQCVRFKHRTPLEFGFQPLAGNRLDNYILWTLMDKSSFTTTVITLCAYYLAISCLQWKEVQLTCGALRYQKLYTSGCLPCIHSARCTYIGKSGSFCPSCSVCLPHMVCIGSCFVGACGCSVVLCTCSTLVRTVCAFRCQVVPFVAFQALHLFLFAFFCVYLLLAYE